MSSSVNIVDPIGTYSFYDEDEMNELFKGRTHCTLSLSPNIVKHDGSTKWMVSVGFKDATNRPIDNGPEFYEEISSIIREKGVLKTSGYFYAMYSKEKGLMINTKRIQPPTLPKHQKDLLAKYGRKYTSQSKYRTCSMVQWRWPCR